MTEILAAYMYAHPRYHGEKRLKATTKTGANDPHPTQGAEIKGKLTPRAFRNP
jgi:hypothetical protein